MLVNRAVNPSPIKSIQRGVVSSVAGSEVSVFISPVDLSKAVLLVNGIYAGYQSSGAVYGGIGGRFDGAGALVFEKSFVSSPMFRADWQVIEYV